jgi:WD40 repeat protein
VNSISFHPQSRLLSTSGYDNTTRLWQIETGREVLQTAGVSGDFSRDGNWLGRRAGRWKFLDPSEFCQRHRGRIHDSHPSGRFGIAPVDGELRIVGIAPSRLLSKSLGKGQACFSPDGKQLIIAREEMGAKTLLRFPVDLQTKDATEDDMVTTVSIGAPRELGVLPRGMSSMAVGNDTVVVGMRSSGQIVSFDSESGSRSDLKPKHPGVVSIDLSADQRFVVSGTWNGKNVRLWDRRSGDLKSNLPSGNATVQFASDRRHWVTSDSQGYFFRSIESPNEKVDTTISFPRSLPGKIAFARDGSLFAMTVDLRTVKLCDTKTRLEFATLRFGADDEISLLDLSHDGGILTVSTRKCSYTCNLNAVRTHLKQHGLDWSSRVVPMADTNPLVVAIDAGALQERNAEVRNASPTYSCSSSYSNEVPVEAAFKPGANRWHSATDDMQGAWVAVNWDRVCNVRRFEIHEVDDRITGFRIQRQVGDGKEWSDLFVAEDDAMSRVKRYASRVETFPGGRRRKTPVFLIRLEKAASASAIRLLITETKPKTGANVSIRRFDID